MTKLPVISGRTLRKVLQRHGFLFARQKGSHMMMRRVEPPHITISIPDHRELAPGTLRGILRDAGLSVDEFKKLVKRL